MTFGGFSVYPNCFVRICLKASCAANHIIVITTSFKDWILVLQSASSETTIIVRKEVSNAYLNQGAFEAQAWCQSEIQCRNEIQGFNQRVFIVASAFRMRSVLKYKRSNTVALLKSIVSMRTKASAKSAEVDTSAHCHFGSVLKDTCSVST